LVLTANELFGMMHAVLDWKHLNLPIRTITDEMSTMTFDDLMAFVGVDYAVAA